MDKTIKHAKASPDILFDRFFTGWKDMLGDKTKLSMFPGEIEGSPTWFTREGENATFAITANRRRMYFVHRFNPDDDPDLGLEYPDLAYGLNQSWIVLTAKPTVNAINYVVNHRPDWLTDDVVKAFAGKLPYNGPYQIDWDSMPTGKTGRFLITDTHGEITTTACDAYNTASRRRVPLDHVTYTPDVVLLINNAQSFGVSCPFQMWSDGVITKKHCQAPGEITPLKDVMRLLSWASRQQAWQGRLQKLAEIQSVNAKTVIAQESHDHHGFSSSGSDCITLWLWETDKGQLWIVEHKGGVLAEDGDSWDYFDVYDSEEVARSKYDEKVKCVTQQ